MKPVFSSGQWAAPDELRMPPPRTVRVSKAGVWATIGAAVLWAVAIALFVLWGDMAVKLLRQSVLRGEGSETYGVVTRVWKVGRSHRKWVDYTFTANGVVFTGDSHVPDEMWYNLHENKPLSIRFLSSNPSVNHPAAWGDSAVPYLVSLLFPAALAALGVSSGRRLCIQRRLAIEGAPTAAVVTRSLPGKDGTSRVEYEFPTDGCGTAKGAGWVDERAEVGATVCAVYIPGNPRLNRPYPLPYCRALRPRVSDHLKT